MIRLTVPTFRIDSDIQTGKKYGMQLLDDHLWNLFEKGSIEADEMLDKARSPGDLQEKLDKAGKLHEAGDAMVAVRSDTKEIPDPKK